MPSPFPGMDPYLEDPGLWPDVHHRLITISSDMLTQQLRPKYYARIEERLYVSDESDPGRSVIIPDVRIAERAPGLVSTFEPAGVATLEVAQPVIATSIIREEIREARLEVIDRTNRLVIAVIEFLSPTNKVKGSRGQDNYEQKRQEVMCSPSHFVEIDLLRDGVPVKLQEQMRPHEYLVHVSRVQERPKAHVWPITLQQRLPVIPIPLRPEDPDGKLDLQAVLDIAYDRAGYDLELDYRVEANPPLDKKAAQWADGWLRGKGLR